MTVDTDIGTIELSPMTVGNYKLLLRRSKKDDEDEYMAYCIKGIDTQKERLKVVREQFSGVMVNVLENLDVSFYHGVQDIKVRCKNKIKVKTGEYDVEGEEITLEEDCGKVHRVPFLSLPEFIGSTDRTKESIRNRVHFGIQDEHTTEPTE